MRIAFLVLCVVGGLVACLAAVITAAMTRMAPPPQVMAPAGSPTGSPGTRPTTRPTDRLAGHADDESPAEPVPVSVIALAEVPAPRADLLRTIIRLAPKDAALNGESIVLVAPPEIDLDTGRPTIRKTRDQDEAARIVRKASVSNPNYEPYLSRWTSVHDVAQWTVQVPEPGTWAIGVEYTTSRSAGGPIVVTVGNHEFRHVIDRARGSRIAEETLEIGAVRVPAAGPLTIAIRPTEPLENSVMLLRAVRLHRVE